MCNCHILIRYGLFATSWSTELPNKYFQDRHFLRAYDLALMAIAFVCVNSFLKKLFFFQESAKVKNCHCCLKRRPREADIFHVLPLDFAWGSTVNSNVFVSCLQAVYIPFVSERNYPASRIGKNNFQCL